jgi:hypothetical protein
MKQRPAGKIREYALVKGHAPPILGGKSSQRVVYMH